MNLPLVAVDHASSDRCRTSAANHAQPCAIDRAGLRAFLISRHPVKTAAAIAAETGIPADTVRRWLSADAYADPSTPHFLRLLAVYGVPFLSAAVTNAPGWLDDAERALRAAELDRAIAHARAERARLSKRRP